MDHSPALLRLLCLLCGLSLHLAYGQPVIDVGCYRIPVSHAIRTSAPQAVNGDVTPLSCISACRESGLHGFAVVKVAECRCSDSLAGPAGVSSSQCDRPCTATSRHKCGSQSHTDLFNVYGIQSGNLREGDVAYLGCFQDKPVDRLIAEFPMDLTGSAGAKVQGCVSHCRDKGRPFAAIAKHSGQPKSNATSFFHFFLSYYCRCGRSYGAQQRVADTNCPGAKSDNECTSFHCLTSRFTTGDYFSVFAPVSHPAEVVNCKNPSPYGPPFMATKHGRGYYLGNTVLYRCNSGYHIRGRSFSVTRFTIECLGNGSWSAPPPSCTAITCRRLNPPVSMNATLMNDIYGILVVGTQMEFTCPSTHRLVVGGVFHRAPKTTITCTNTGRWSGGIPECRKEVCDVPVPPPHASILSPSGSLVEVGGSISYSCECGFRLRGASERHCSHGIFVPEEPECVQTQCRPRFAPANGTISGNSSAVDYYGTWYPLWNAQEVAHYTCNNDSQLEGSPFAVCLVNGLWNHPPPKCVPAGEQACFRGLVAPVITAGDENILVRTGQRFMAACEASGNPSPRVTWWKLDGGMVPIDENRALELSNGSLFFFKFGFEDKGKYQCIAHNGAGKNATRIVNLDLSEPPVIRPLRSSIFQRRGGPVTMSCHAVGAPKPRITWTRNGRPLASKWQISGGAGESEASTSAVTLDDTDTYKCVATNSADGAEATNSSVVHLHVEACPPLPGKQRVIGGQSIPLTNASWQAMLWNATDDRRFQLVCGAIIIRHRYVLTAAHCMYGITVNNQVPPEFVIRMGVKKILIRNGVDTSTRRSILHVHIHPEYDPITLENDIALIRLEEPVDYVPGAIQPIPLPREGTSDLCLELRDTFSLLSGWGRKNTFSALGTKNLQGLFLPAVTNDVCRAAFSANGDDVTENMLCVGYGDGRDACHGDSGGPAAAYNPVTDKWVLVGIISWGDRLCGRPGRYTVLTRASRYNDWITATIRRDRTSPTCP